MSEQADQFEERDEEEEETDQENRESGSGPGSPDRQGQSIQEQPVSTGDPSAD
jgi:hypothetical protein